MEIFAARGPGPSHGFSHSWRGTCVPALLCLAGFCAWAEEIPPGDLTAVAATSAGRASGRMELSSTSLPLFDSADGATRASRVDLIWLPPRQPGLGLALGLRTIDTPGLRPAGSGVPAIDLGFHLRYTLDSQYRIDVTAWRRMAPTDTLALVHDRQSGYGARVEMQLGSSGRGFVAERGFVGLQLESGARITVRRSGGRPMLYYRTRF